MCIYAWCVSIQTQCALPHSGLLVDVYHNYEYLFIMCGSVILTGGLLSLLMNICHFRALRKHEEAKKANGGGPNHIDAEKQAQAEPITVAAEQANEAAQLEKEADALKDVWFSSQALILSDCLNSREPLHTGYTGVSSRGHVRTVSLPFFSSHGREELWDKYYCSFLVLSFLWSDFKAIWTTFWSAGVTSGSLLLYYFLIM